MTTEVLAHACQRLMAKSLVKVSYIAAKVWGDNKIAKNTTRMAGVCNRNFTKVTKSLLKDAGSNNIIVSLQGGPGG